MKTSSTASKQINPLCDHLPTIQRVLLFAQTRSMHRLVEYSTVCDSWNELMTHGHGFPILRQMIKAWPAGTDKWAAEAAGAGVEWLLESFLHIRFDATRALLTACRSGRPEIVRMLLDAPLRCERDAEAEADAVERLWAESFDRLRRARERPGAGEAGAALAAYVASASSAAAAASEQAAAEKEANLLFRPLVLLKVHDHEGNSPLHLARNVDTALLLLRRCPALIKTQNFADQTVLHTVPPAVALWLLRRGRDLHKEGEAGGDGGTKKEGDADDEPVLDNADLRCLVIQASSRAAPTAPGSIPLHLFARAGDTHMKWNDETDQERQKRVAEEDEIKFEICKLLLALEPRTALRPDAQRRVVLHHAAMTANVPLTQLLLTQYKADPRVETGSPTSPVYLAAAAAATHGVERAGRVVDMLVEHGASLTRLLMIAAMTRNLPMARLLLLRDKDVPILGSGAMHESVRRQNVDLIQATLDTVRRRKDAATAAGEEFAVVELDSVVNEVSAITGTAPLHEIAHSVSGPQPQFGAGMTRDVAVSAIETVKALLLVPGANVNVQSTPGGDTVMHLLARTQGTAVLPLVNQMLANCGGLDLDIVNAEGKTCLEVASEARMGNGVESAVRIHLNNRRLGMGTFRQ